MKAFLDCIPCQQRQMLKILRLSTDDQQVHEQVLRQTVAYLADTGWETDPMSLMKKTYDMVVRATGNIDPYRELKYQSNVEILELYSGLQTCIQQSEDTVLTACKLAVAGNIMDFGAKDHFNIQETIQYVLETDFAINHYDNFVASLQKASSLLLFADNAGELVFDKLLLETIVQRYPLSKISLVVKERPILNDATMQDVEQTGLKAIPNIEFRVVNTSSNGSSAWMPADVSAWIREHDVVISKGQANYESLSDFQNVYFLLIAKCPILAHHTGTYNGALIFHYSSPKSVV